MENKTHWKKLTNPDYLGSYDFAVGEERIVTVKNVTRETVSGPDGKKEECTIVHFIEPYKPLIMNATNSKMLTKLAESPYVEDWTGKSFKLAVRKIKAFGDVVDALRIMPDKVIRQKPVLEIESDNFNSCRASYLASKDQVKLLGKIKEKYEVSPEVEQQLIKSE